MVENMVKNGILVAIIGYNLAPIIHLKQMIDEIGDAIIFLDSWCKQRGTKSLYTAGHSAGAHLMFMSLLNINRSSLHCLKGLVLLSGIYDMDHVIWLKANEKLK